MSLPVCPLAVEALTGDTQLDVGSGDLNPDLHACMASPFPTELALCLMTQLNSSVVSIFCFVS